MKKRCMGLCALLLTALLSGCGAVGGTGSDGAAQSAAQMLQEEYRIPTAFSVTAQVHCDWQTQTEDYTLACRWNAEGVSSTEIVAPEELSGIRAEFDAESMTLTYDDMSIGAGETDGVSPAQIVPMTINAIREGYILEQGAQEIDGNRCLRLTFDTTDADGEKIEYIVCFSKNHLPVQAEVQMDGRVVYTIAFTEFAVASETQ